MDYDFYDYADFKEAEWAEVWPRDIKIDEARAELTGFFNENTEGVFYLKQVEVFFERKFYHWITAKAVNELIEDGFLRTEEVPLGEGARVKFVFNKKLRYFKRPISKCMELIREYSDPVIAIACGRQAEVLLFNALTRRIEGSCQKDKT